MSEIFATPTHFFQINVNIIVASLPISSTKFSPFRFPWKHFKCIFELSSAFHTSHSFHHVIHPNDILCRIIKLQALYISVKAGKGATSYTEMMCHLSFNSVARCSNWFLLMLHENGDYCTA